MAHPLQVSVLPDCSDNLDRIEGFSAGWKCWNFTEKLGVHLGDCDHHLGPIAKKKKSKTQIVIYMISPLLVTKNTVILNCWFFSHNLQCLGMPQLGPVYNTFDGTPSPRTHQSCGPRFFSGEQRWKPWLVLWYRGLYYPTIWGLFHKPI